MEFFSNPRFVPHPKVLKVLAMADFALKDAEQKRSEVLARTLDRASDEFRWIACLLRMFIHLAGVPDAANPVGLAHGDALRLRGPFSFRPRKDLAMVSSSTQETISESCSII